MRFTTGAHNELLFLPVTARQLVTLAASLFIFNDAPKLRFHLQANTKDNEVAVRHRRN
jgi:hypothetical protein